ncbi:DUF45 domain-containing protein [Altererythrobacter aerius]|uniref:DUF45 domain-containing protein n=1 Tax=Tsuneonella aeria TaxID=1837929 RepID=A0A6I4TEN8_9SPHN|nr:DUF45 domain-containing protein [Tsuneonella aeria]
MIGWLARSGADPVIEVTGRLLPIAITRNARARRLTMRLSPDGTAVRLTLPRWCPEAEAIAFVHARSGWLEGQLARVPRADPPGPSGMVRFRGQTFSIDWNEGARRKPALRGDVIKLGGPAETIAPRLQRWLESEALTLMSADVSHFAARAGVRAPPLRLSRAQRRWGSLSSSGTVRINWRLIQAPDSVRRSVVAHEITHCLHFDHSPAFHAALGRIFDDDLAAADAWLTTHGRGLYASFG